MKFSFSLMLLASSICSAQPAAENDHEYCSARKDAIVSSPAYKLAFYTDCVNVRILQRMNARDEAARNSRMDFEESNLQSQWLLKTGAAILARRKADAAANIQRTAAEEEAEEAELKMQWTLEQIRIKELVRGRR